MLCDISWHHVRRFLPSSDLESFQSAWTQQIHKQTPDWCPEETDWGSSWRKHCCSVELEASSRRMNTKLASDGTDQIMSVCLSHSVQISSCSPLKLTCVMPLTNNIDNQLLFVYWIFQRGYLQLFLKGNFIVELSRAPVVQLIVRWRHRAVWCNKINKI